MESKPYKKRDYSHLKGKPRKYKPRTPYNELDKKQRLKTRKEMFQYWSEHMLDKGECSLSRIAQMFNIRAAKVEQLMDLDRWYDRLDKMAEQEEKSTDRKVKKNMHNTTVPLTKEEMGDFFELLNEAELSDKQRLFCVYYLQTYDAKSAARKAGYNVSKTRNIPSWLMNDKEVQRVIKCMKELMSTKVYVTAHDILDQYIKIAFADITDFIKFDGQGVTLRDSSEVNGQMISEVRQGRDGITFKLHDKMKALDKLDKLFDLIPDKKLELDREKHELQKKIVEQGANGGSNGSKVVVINNDL